MTVTAAVESEELSIMTDFSSSAAANSLDATAAGIVSNSSTRSKTRSSSSTAHVNIQVLSSTHLIVLTKGSIKLSLKKYHSHHTTATSATASAITTATAAPTLVENVTVANEVVEEDDVEEAEVVTVHAPCIMNLSDICLSDSSFANLSTRLCFHTLTDCELTVIAKYVLVIV